jgi:hypothetical protein
MLQADDGVGTIQFFSTVPTPSSPVTRSCVSGSLKPACFTMLFRKAASGTAHFWKVKKLSRTKRTVTGVPWANWLPIVCISFVAKSVALPETGWAKRLILDARSKSNSMETLHVHGKMRRQPTLQAATYNATFLRRAF